MIKQEATKAHIKHVKKKAKKAGNHFTFKGKGLNCLSVIAHVCNR